MKRLVAALVCGVATAAFAGGPIYTFDYGNRIPFAWNLASWPGGHVPVYTDLGPLGTLTNAQANGLVAAAVAQWSSVPTSSFRAAVAGDFSALGLGDVSLANIGSVIGADNGGGIDVVYDSDGTIMSSYFGVPPTSTLGITDIEYSLTGTPEILEAWVVLSGPGVRAEDPNGVGFAGVVTHEMGHALNLAHSQADGAVINDNDLPNPEGCDAPWTTFPEIDQIETMTPYITATPTGTGAAMATVDRLDDTAALSELYPGPGWPASKGTITGRVLDPSGNPITGVNVIARNVADPYNDFTSYISGQITKGQAEPDGSFVFDGLTPGASYVLYTDLLIAGAFSVPTVVVLPGPEEYYNGPLESGDGVSDDRCAWTPITVAAGSPVDVTITLNHIPGAPTFITAPNLSVQSVPTDITPDGAVVVGGEGTSDAPIFRWDVDAGTLQTLGGMLTGSASISADGSKIVANIVDTDGINKAAIYANGAWTALPPVPGAVACGSSGSGPMYTSAYDISGDGSTVVGLSYGSMGCGTSTIRGFKWTAAGGTVALPKVDSLSRAGRANAVNYDGSVIVGWDDRNDGLRRGEQWRSGVASLIKENNQPVGEADGVSSDGQHVVGSSSTFTSGNAWLWSPGAGVQNLGVLPGQSNAVASAVNDDGSVVVGRSVDLVQGIATPTIWTAGLHWTDLNQFLSAQGVNTTGVDISIATAMSGDGRTLTGFSASRFGYVGWVLKTPTSIVCHSAQTLSVPFPQGLDEHLGHGDTLGPCPCFDADGDGVSTCAGDCNDSNAAVHPGALELCDANGVDDDCNGIVDDVKTPADRPSLSVASAAGETQLSWTAAGAATAYDVFSGDLGELRAAGGNYAALAHSSCAADGLATTTLTVGGVPPAPGNGTWFLVRPTNCAGAGSYDESGSGQAASRDAGVGASPAACP